MLVEAEKLKWLGLDMRPQWRRRAAVAGTYAAYLLAVWVHSGVVLGALIGLTMASGLAGSLPIVRDVYESVLPKIRRVGAILIVLNLVGLVFVGLGAWWGVRVGGGPWLALWAFSLLISDSPLGWHRMVDNGYRGWMAQAMRRQDKLSWRQCRRLARKGFATGLDGFAWYEYGVRFKKLTETQKAEIEALRREYPHGRWMRPNKVTWFDDERLRNEENELRARVQRVMTWVLVVSAIVFTWALLDDVTIGTDLALAWAWTLAGLAVTLRQAIPLWTEVDPREMVGELAVVGGVEA
jgi:hypothetical protein